MDVRQGRNHGKNLGATSAMVGRICNRVKASQNLGATSVAPVDTSLNVFNRILRSEQASG